MSVGPLQPPDEPLPRPTQSVARRLLNRLLNIVEVGVLLAILSFFAGLLGEFHHLFDLASHFRLQAGLVTLVGGFVLLMYRASWFPWFACVMGAALLGSTYAYFIPAAADTEAPSRTLLTLNVLQDNRWEKELTDYLMEQDVDIIMLLETDQRWVNVAEKALKERFPHYKLVPREDHFGMCFFSKWPWRSINVRRMTQFDIPSIDARFDAGENGEPAYRFIGTHAAAPMERIMWQARDEQFDMVAELIEKEGSSRTIFAGDLNCTVWAPSLKAFLKRTGLRDSSLGHGLKTTWGIHEKPLMQLPIDHVLLGDGLHADKHEVGPKIGSDHRPVIVEFSRR